jgi:hypothetical protein
MILAPPGGPVKVGKGVFGLEAKGLVPPAPLGVYGTIGEGRWVYAVYAARWLFRISPPEPSGFFVTLNGLVSPDTEEHVHRG